MSKKTSLIAPRLPRGFEDRSPADIAATNEMIATIRKVYETYGFDPVETPFFEYTDTLGKFLPDEDRPNQGVFSLQDDDEQWMSLRYDLTAPLARHFAENFNDLPKPYRTYRQGYVFRNEKPGPGRFRQFMQFDADTVGAAGPEADAEICMMMADTMDALGLQGKYVVRVNNRKVLDGVMEAAGVADEAQKLSVLRAIDKLDKFGVEGVKLLLGAGRKDESGDFTKGAGLDDESIARLIRLFGYQRSTFVSDPEQKFGLTDDVWQSDEDFFGSNQVNGAKIQEYAYFDCNRMLEVLEKEFSDSPKSLEGLQELKVMNSLFRASRYGSKRIKIDPSVVRGLEYYTGPVFEIELTFPVTNEKGQEVVFGSVGGGGRYDGLVSRFRKEPVPATGFSIGVSRLAHALKLTGLLGNTQPIGPVVVCVMDKDQKAGYQKMVSELRAAGIRAEMYLGNPKNVGRQFAYADQRNSPAVIIEGTQEREQGIIQIKDLVAGKEASKEITDNEQWKAERPGQFECKRTELVDRITELLKSQGQ